MTATTRHRQTMIDISHHLLARERAQVIARGDALRELAQRRLRQHGVEFGLTEQNQLQQFAFIGFEIGEQAQLFEHIGR